MAKVWRFRGEPFESLLQRFNDRVKREGTIKDVLSHGKYEKPSVRRKRKATAAAQRRGPQ